MKPFAIIQLRPEDITADNEYQSLLKYGDLTQDQVIRIRAEQAGLPELSLEDLSGIIIGGSPFDITTPEAQKSAIQCQLETQFSELFDQVVTRDFPLLGCCSGNGLLGSYLGAPISRQYAEPVSCRTVRLTEAGLQDPLLEGFPEHIEVLLGHKEACDQVPAGAILLIEGQQCPVQMFRLGQNVYATQFHPEGDAKGFQLRVDVYKNHGYFDPGKAAQLCQSLASVHTPYAQKILARFVSRYQV